MQFETWLLFLATSVGISFTPGPNGLLALTHGAIHGNKKAIWTINGGLLGFIIVIALCMFGIGAVVKMSVVWLTVLKVVGGAYLIWLGIKIWRSPPIAFSEAAVGTDCKAITLFRSGFLTAVTNPKGLLFFSALLPQFIDPHRKLFPQFLMIAATYTVVEFVVEYFYAATAHRLRPWLARAGRRFNQCCGGIFLAIGAVLALR